MVLVSEPDEVAAHGEKLTRADPRELRRSAREGQPGAAAGRAGRRLGRGRAVARRRDRARDAGARTRRVRTSRVSRRSSSPGACRTGSAEIRRGRERGDTMVFVAHSPGRAERTIELLADYEIFAAPIERAEDVHDRVGARRRRPPVARLPAAGCRPPVLGRDRRLRGRAARRTSAAGRRRARSSPTSAI